MKRATVSARPQERPVGGCAVLELKAYSTAIRAVSPTASDAAHRRVRVVYRQTSETLKVSKFAVNTLCGTKDECFVCSLFARWRLKLLKFRTDDGARTLGQGWRELSP